MGVDCLIKLPANVRCRDVADVIGILAGKSKEKIKITNSYYVEVENVKIEGIVELPECARILIYGPFSDATTKIRNGEDPIYCLYHFEPDEYDGVLLMPKSTPFWIAVGRKLVDFFGGSIAYNDCDREETNYEVNPNPRIINSPQSGEAWTNFQDKLIALQPVSLEEYHYAKNYSAY